MTLKRDATERESLGNGSLQFPSALEVAMKHGLGDADGTTWTNQRLGDVMATGRQAGVNRSTIATWLQTDPARNKKISEPHAHTLFRVMVQHPLSPTRHAILVALADAYFADFPERDPDPIKLLINDCEVVPNLIEETNKQEDQYEESDDLRTGANFACAEQAHNHSMAAGSELQKPSIKPSNVPWTAISGIAGVVLVVIALMQFVVREPSNEASGIGPNSVVVQGEGNTVNEGASK